LRLALGAALCLAAGCTGPGVIKAYPGDTRGADEIGTIVTIMREGEFTVTDNRITAVDGVSYEKGGHTANVLPGVRRIGIQGLLRSRMQPRTQHCAFDLNVEPGCTYRPMIPAYPRSAYDLKPDEEWKLTRAMTVVAECSDTSYALQVPLDCSARP
jgi:hypothetical protein